MRKISFFALCFTSSIGCSSDEREPSLLIDGSYEGTGFSNPGLSEALVAGTLLELRMSEMSAKFFDPEGQETEVTLTETPKEDWPTGCPTMADYVKMETVVLDVSELTIGDVTVEDPKLTAYCADGSVLLTGFWADCDEGSCNDGEVSVRFDPLPLQ